ncbi:hypothetical protein [Roseateles toxinivorans]|uniref:Uncharacterized protein n=1 Tax=Roseateles toxinivorans TaxID=270368 RepID=A0A4R6QK10_9BURK|nr:hypothetical protein [Roseateles toxinivorans]TDP62839.1 hypothetical protein DES47_106134 [Roseateles toxinivorans]
MSDKTLTEAEWKKFAKGRGLKDAALLKAMGELDKAKTPEDQLAALDDIEKQSEQLRKANKADKEVTGYLDDLDKALVKERKLAEAEARKAAAEQVGDEEEESPTLLTTKMVPLLRDVRKGTVLQAMVATVGNDCVVLVSRKPIGSPRRKLLTAELGTTSGVKFVTGECIFEQNAHTFVLLTQAAGMAKKIKEALLKQTEQRYKIRVRGEDPNDIDDDGEPAEPGPGSAPPVAPGEAGDAAFELALEGWRSARGAAVTKLKALAKEVADAKLPDSATAIIQMSAVLKNLTAEPRTAQQVNELMRYVSEDDIVLDVCDIDGDIRTPMVNALQAMQRAMSN